MAMIRVPLSKGKEQTVAPDGEYDLVVRKFEQVDSKAGNPMLRASIGFEDEAGYELITHFFNLPLDNDPDNVLGMKMREMKRFLTVFSIPHDTAEDGNAEFDTDDVVGATGKCRVVVASIDGESGPREINRLRLPRVED